MLLCSQKERDKPTKTKQEDKTMKEIWNVVTWMDELANAGGQMIIIGDPEEIKKFCEIYAEENVITCWVTESYEVE